MSIEMQQETSNGPRTPNMNPHFANVCENTKRNENLFGALTQLSTGLSTYST